MNYLTMYEINNCLEKYSDSYAIGNESETLSVYVLAYISEEKKEFFLNDLDKILPYGLNFSHNYKNGKLKVIFKEMI